MQNWCLNGWYSLGGKMGWGNMWSLTGAFIPRAHLFWAVVRTIREGMFYNILYPLQGINNPQPATFQGFSCHLGQLTDNTRVKWIWNLFQERQMQGFGETLKDIQKTPFMYRGLLKRKTVGHRRIHMKPDQPQSPSYSQREVDRI